VDKGKRRARRAAAEANVRLKGDLMSHPDHDKFVNAFLLTDPNVKTCNRGGLGGYTHIHGPNQPCAEHHCTSHAIIVEKRNGTVSIRSPIAKELGASLRPPNVTINHHPLGYSFRVNYGNFDYAFTAEEVLRKWLGYVTFAVIVIHILKANNRW
jgi:hypothetical protein